MIWAVLVRYEPYSPLPPLRVSRYTLVFSYSHILVFSYSRIFGSLDNGYGGSESVMNREVRGEAEGFSGRIHLLLHPSLEDIWYIPRICSNCQSSPRASTKINYIFSTPGGDHQGPCADSATSHWRRPKAWKKYFLLLGPYLLLLGPYLLLLGPYLLLLGPYLLLPEPVWGL